VGDRTITNSTRIGRHLTPARNSFIGIYLAKEEFVLVVY
jgi:hypothetical protein